jgi:hypothetical protein
MNTSQLLALILKQGGATIKPKSLELYTGQGFGVAVSKSYERIIPLAGDSGDFQGAFNSTLTELRFLALSRGLYIGAWIDNGKLYLDLSEVVQGESYARHLGYMRKQLAIWDFTKMQSIDTSRRVG